MKNKKLIEFGKSFFGAFLGIMLYEIYFDFDDPFDEYWKNYITEITLMVGCILIGILVIRFLVNKLSLFQLK